MVAILRDTLIVATIFLIFTLVIQARVDPSQRCLEPNELFQSCGTACPLTCEDVLTSNLNKVCTFQCVVGCFCEKGFVRENKQLTSRCIKMEECR